MKIDNRDLTGTAPAQAGRSQDTQKPAGTAPAPPGTASGDRVELSSGLASVSRALAAYSSDHAGKVEQLTTQVQSGSYNPSSLAISQGIVAQALTGGVS
jgi:hypothetical protein